MVTQLEAALTWAPQDPYKPPQHSMPPGIPFQGPRPQQWPPRAEPHSLTGAEAGGALSGSSVLTESCCKQPLGKAQEKQPQRQQTWVGDVNGEGEVAS